MYWNEKTRTLIFFQEDYLRQVHIMYEFKKVPFDKVDLQHFSTYRDKTMEFIRQAEIIKYFDDEILKFKCFKNRFGKKF